MRFPYKVLLFIFSFSAVFYWLRFTPLYSAQIILEDLGGVPWLYAAIVTLFSILVGFVLQKALENWNKLL